MPQSLIITITLQSGERVSAPIERWVQGLILRLQPTELVELMQMVDRASPVVTAEQPFTSATVPADPKEFLRRIK